MICQNSDHKDTKKNTDKSILLQKTAIIYIIFRKQRLDKDFLQPDSEIKSGAPFLIVDGECVGIADEGVIIADGKAGHFVSANLLDDGCASGENAFGEVVVDVGFRVAERNRGFGVEDVSWQGREMNQPTVGRHVVVAVATTDGDIGHLEIHLTIDVFQSIFFARNLTVLSLSRHGEEKTACRATLNVAVDEGGGIGKTAVVENVVGIHVQRPQAEHFFGSRHIVVSTANFVPSREIMGVLIGDVEAETRAV